MPFFPLAPYEIQAFSYAFVAFATGIAAFFIFSTGAKEREARSFALVALSAAIINIFAFLYYTVSDLELARTLRVISQSFVPTFYIFLILFSFDIYRGYSPLSPFVRRTGNALIALFFLFFPFFIFDALGSLFVVGEVIALPSVKLTPLPGPLLVPLIVLSSLATLFVVYILSAVFLRAFDRSIRRQAALLVLFLVIPLVTRLFGYASWFGSDATSLILTLITGPAFAFGVTYAVLRHQVFHLRLVAAQVFLFALWTFIFIKAILAPSWIAALPDIVLLAAAIVLGIFLIRSVLKEVVHRERLETLTKELATLNETLEEKVKDRTAALNRAKEHTETIFENLTFGLVEYTEKLQVTRVNKAAEALLGISRDEVIGKNFSAVTGEVKAPALMAVLHAEPLKNVPAPKDTLYDRYTAPPSAVEIVVETPRRRELQVITSPIVTVEGGQHRHLKLLRDVTRERIIDRSKTEFISIASHQLRTPLTALKWIFNLLLDGSSGTLPPKARELADRGNAAAERMIRLINDLLRVAQIEDGRFGYNFSLGDLAALVSAEVSNMQVLAKARGVALSFTTQHLPPLLFDATWMSLVVQNLLDNALKYSEAGDRVTVALTQEGSRAALTVADTGIGMSEEEHGRLFTKFFRSKKATSMFTDGTGLGLFIVRKVVEQHEGTIAVSSRAGVGTSVRIELPIAAPLERLAGVRKPDVDMRGMGERVV